MNAEEWLPHDDEGLAMLVNYFKEVMYFQLELKDDFLEYCDDDTKKKDLKHKKNYDLIKKEWLRDAESPE